MPARDGPVPDGDQALASRPPLRMIFAAPRVPSSETDLMSNQLDVDALFFDWGGTLTDVRNEADIWPDCIRRACDVVRVRLGDRYDHAVEQLYDAYLRALAATKNDPEHREIDFPDLLARWGQTVGLGDQESWPVTLAIDAFWQSWVGRLAPIDGTADALAELRQRGYRIAIVSNVTAPWPYALAEMKRLGLKRHVEAVAFSSAVGFRKPHPAILDTAIEGLFGKQQQPPAERMLFIGDGPVVDLADPQRRGMKTALVAYDGIAWPEDDLRTANPDLRIDHVRELLDVLPPRPAG